MLARLLPLAVLALVACSHARAVRGPNGESDWWVAGCAGDATSCEEAARAQCPQGFRTADAGERVGSFRGGQDDTTVFDPGRSRYVAQSRMTGNYQGTSAAMATGEPRGRIWFTCDATASGGAPPASP